VLVVLASACLTARSAGAQDATIDRLLAVQQSLVDAAGHAEFLRFNDAKSTLLAAAQTVRQIGQDARNDIPDKGIIRRLKASLRKVGARMKRARADMSKRKPLKTQLSSLARASDLLARAIQPAGYPLVVENGTPPASFRDPDAAIELQTLRADGSPCTEPAAVELVNDGFGSAVDPASLDVNPAGGVVRLRTGPDVGAARVVVHACGRSTALPLFNTGRPTPAGLPSGFPTNLPATLYLLSVSICQPKCGSPVTAEIDFSTAQDLANDIENRVRIQASPGVTCSKTWRYTPFDGTSFSGLLFLKCSFQGSTVLNAEVHIDITAEAFSDSCPSGIHVAAAHQMSLQNWPGCVTGVGAAIGMKVDPDTTDWAGTQITETVTPAGGTCDFGPLTIGGGIPLAEAWCTGNAAFTVGSTPGDPPDFHLGAARNGFVDFHQGLSCDIPFSVLHDPRVPSSAAGTCTVVCGQTYSCEGTPIGTFTITYTLRAGTLNGTNVTFVSAIKN
jgi:hypothetical protein